MLYVTRERLEEIEQMKKEDGLDQALEKFAFVDLKKKVKLTDIENQIDPVYSFIIVLINLIGEERVSPASVRFSKLKKIII